MRLLQKREKRLLIYLGLLLAFLIGDKIYRHWTYSITKETEHFFIYSSATQEQTDKVAAVIELVYDEYKGVLGQLGKTLQPHRKLKVKLYKDREEFRHCNNRIGWAEAFYRYPYCQQYYDSGSKNPCQWATHEIIHQINNEAAHFKLRQWLEEGLASYMSSCIIDGNSLRLSDVDINTYPIWWFDTFATSGNLQEDKDNKSIIPLRAIISGHGGLDMDEYFNLYYLHWWSLVHFLMHYNDGQYRDGLSKVISEHGTLSSFDKNIGKVEDIEKQWYQYTLELKNEWW